MVLRKLTFDRQCSDNCYMGLDLNNGVQIGWKARVLSQGDGPEKHVTEAEVMPQLGICGFDRNPAL